MVSEVGTRDKTLKYIAARGRKRVTKGPTAGLFFRSAQDKGPSTLYKSQGFWPLLLLNTPSGLRHSFIFLSINQLFACPFPFFTGTPFVYLPLVRSRNPLSPL